MLTNLQAYILDAFINGTGFFRLICSSSSNSLMMDYEGGDLLLAGAAGAGYWVTAQAVCCRLGGDLNSGLAVQFQ